MLNLLPLLVVFVVVQKNSIVNFPQCIKMGMYMRELKRQ